MLTFFITISKVSEKNSLLYPLFYLPSQFIAIIFHVNIYLHKTSEREKNVDKKGEKK